MSPGGARDRSMRGDGHGQVPVNFHCCDSGAWAIRNPRQNAVNFGTPSAIAFGTHEPFPTTMDIGKKLTLCHVYS